MKAVIYDSVIKNWLIVNADTSFHADVAIRDGKIVALWKGLTCGIINAVATDHCPFLFKTEKIKKR
jgi:dihydroorotase-like cyclic amidohydrolase